MNKIITFGIPFVLGLCAIWIVQERGWDFFFTYYLPALTTLSAAFFGAYFAFQFQRNHEKEDTKKLNVVNGNIAVFTLLLMASNLKNIQKQIIAPERNPPLHYLIMPATFPINVDNIKLNIETLHFLLETDNRKLLGDLAVEAQRYQGSVNAINERSKLHIEEIQPLLERAESIKGDDYTSAQVKGALGDRLYTAIKTMTEEAVKGVDDTIVSLKTVTDKLRITLKELYPDKRQ